MWTWIESTGLAVSIRDSLLATALLSGVHIVGMALTTGASLVTALRLTGLAFRDFTPADVVTMAARAVTAGLALSVGSGLLLVAPRAASAVDNSYFLAKMIALLAATAFHLAVLRPALRQPRTGREDGSRAPASAPGPSGAGSRTGVGAASFALWFTVAALGCAFILLE